MPDKACVLILLLCLTVPVGADRLLKTYPWDSMESLPPSSSLVEQDTDSALEGSSLRIESTESSPQTIPLMTVENPEIATPQYAIMGDIRYENVQGKTYLEMWNRFEDGSAYFSRTMAGNGPMGVLSGTSSWRPVRLPFDSTGSTAKLVALEINLCLQGTGVVEIGPLSLYEASASRTSAGAASPPVPLRGLFLILATSLIVVLLAVGAGVLLWAKSR